MSTIRVLLIVLLLVVVNGKTCIFLHGAGQTQDRPPTTRFRQYWGHIEQFTSQCSTHWFNHHDTTYRGFDDPILTSGYCTVAALGPNSQGNVIKDTIVFTHSMGNLIFASALKQGVCSLDSSSSWYAVSPPLYGTKAINEIEQVCGNPEMANILLVYLVLDQNFCTMDSPAVQFGIQNGIINSSSSGPSVESIKLASAQLLASAPNFVQKITAAIASTAWDVTALTTNGYLKVAGVLDPSADVGASGPTEPPLYVNQAWTSLLPSYAGLVGLDQVVNRTIQGGVCGKSPFGLLSKDSLELLALSALVGYGEQNDGMVGLSSCQGLSTSSAWNNNPQSNYYLHNFNHADTTGQNGGPITAWFAARR